MTSKSLTRRNCIPNLQVNKSSGVRYDQIVVPTGFYSSKAYPEKLRRIGFFDSQTEKRLTFLTSQLTLPAIAIADLYRSRWHVELFFKWIKQRLRIKAFYGISENAVKTRIRVGLSVYLLVAIMKKRLYIDLSFYSRLQILSLTLFEKKSFIRLLSSPIYTNEIAGNYIQSKLLSPSENERKTLAFRRRL